MNISEKISNSLFLSSYNQVLELSKSSMWRSWIESRIAEADNMVIHSYCYLNQEIVCDDLISLNHRHGSLEL